jgi:hypothetical protein
MLITLARIAEAIDWPAPDAQATATGASSNRGEQRSGCPPLGVTDLAVKSPRQLITVNHTTVLATNSSSTSIASVVHQHQHNVE